jgi:hypothetical protein
MVCIEGKIIRKRYEKRISGFEKLYVRLWNRKYPVFQGLQALPQQNRFEAQKKRMKKVILILTLQMSIVCAASAQTMSTKTLASSSRTTSTNPLDAVSGIWTGTQTSDDGQYPQQISFQLTPSGEFIMAGQNGVTAAKGTYAYSGNTITGIYKLTSSGESIRFTGNFDLASQKLTCTQGFDPKTTGQGKWIATKNANAQVQTFKPNNINRSTSNNTTTSQSNTSSKGGLNAYDFYMTSVIVHIYTGNDNKESSSLMGVDLFNPASTLYSTTNQPGIELLFSTTGGATNYNSKAELKANSKTTIALSTPYSTGFDGRPRYREMCINLGYLLTTGVELKVGYAPNLPTDAWKIDKVEIEFEFKNSKGEIHPTFSKTILYPTVSNLMTATNNILVLKVNNFFMPVY